MVETYLQLHIRSMHKVLYLYETQFRHKSVWEFHNTGWGLFWEKSHSCALHFGASSKKRRDLKTIWQTEEIVWPFKWVAGWNIAILMHKRLAVIRKYSSVNLLLKETFIISYDELRLTPNLAFVLGMCVVF